MYKYKILLLLSIGLVSISCIQNEKAKKTNLSGNFDNFSISDSIYNNVINYRYQDQKEDTIVLGKFLSENNNLANFGFYKVNINDSNNIEDIFLYLKYRYLDSNTQKQLMMTHRERDSRKICFYLYNDTLSYSDDYVRNKKISFDDVLQIIEDYYLRDSVHLKFDVYNRSKGVEIKFHYSAGEEELEKLLSKTGISYINVINKFCYKQFNKKIFEVSNEQLLILKDSLYFSTDLMISYSQTGSFDVYNVNVPNLRKKKNGEK